MGQKVTPAHFSRAGKEGYEMPLHRISLGDHPADQLQAAVEELEAKGEVVVSAESWGNEWLVITRPKPRVERRAAKTQKA